MKITLAGLQTREAAALTIFIHVAMKGWVSETVALQPGLALPGADFYIIDLAGGGLAQWSVKAEADLLTLLGGRSALLLTAPNNPSWNDRVHGNGQQRLICLARPYGGEVMRAALVNLVSAAPSLSTKPAVAEAVAPPSAVQPSATPQPSPLPAVPWASLHSLRTMFPDLQKHLLLSRVLDMLAAGRPCELRLSLHHALVMHPAQGWVAHNAEPDMLAWWAQHGSAVASMSVRELTSAEAVQRVKRSGSMRTSLDTFLWVMAESSMGLETPPSLSDAELKLCSMPSFTRIPGASSLYIQLAAICVRLPQTLSGLRAIFPLHDPSDIARFMLLATLSGHGHLSLVQAPVPGRRKVTPRLKPKSAPATGGFFRAMLQKLF